MKSADNIIKSHNAKAVVIAFIEALNNEDFDSAREQLSDDLYFKGVMGERIGADVYLADMKKMRLKYQVLKVFAEENDVCLWYSIKMGEKNILSSGWYKIELEKIKSFEVVFDPRPILT